jgi:hypothetical protein
VREKVPKKKRKREQRGRKMEEEISKKNLFVLF